MKTCLEGETSTRPMVGIFAPFAKTLVTRLAVIEDEGSRSIHRSSNFAMLHNVNLNIVNLNILTLCLLIFNRMTPPTQHPLYPLLEVEYDNQHRAHILSDNDAEVSLPPLRPRTHTWAHQWDERYMPYIRHAGFLELVHVVNHGLPPLDPALLTAAVDRCECILCTKTFL